MRCDEAHLQRLEPALDPVTMGDLRYLTRPLGIEALREIFDLYIADLPERLQQIRASIAVGDTPELTRAAHALCGSSVSIGARRLGALCRQLEQCNEPLHSAALVEQIEWETTRVLAAIEAEVLSADAS